MHRNSTSVLALLCGAACAGAFANSQAATYKLVYAFQGGTDGAIPVGGLLDVGGTLYGATVNGGSNNKGTLYSLAPATGSETVLYTFSSNSRGRYPNDGLIKVGNRLYGTTYKGGSKNCEGGCGTVFSLNLASGDVKSVYEFQGGTDGTNPVTSLLDVRGTLYGTTFWGGSTTCDYGQGCGTVFSLTPATGVERILYAFAGGNDGTEPSASLIDVGGTLYGTTDYGGGSNEGGTVYSVNPTTGAETVIYAFKHPKHGEIPYSGLLNVHGILYGTASHGGAYGDGTVYAARPRTGTGIVLYSFQGGSDGSTPGSSLVRVGGLLYGTTQYGGAGNCTDGCGVLFSIDPATGTETAVHSFQGGSDGALPGHLVNIGGTLYGETASGGGATSCQAGCGTVYTFTP